MNSTIGFFSSCTKYCHGNSPNKIKQSSSNKMSSHKYSYSKQTPQLSKKQPNHLQSLSIDPQEKPKEYREV